MWKCAIVYKISLILETHHWPWPSKERNSAIHSFSFSGVAIAAWLCLTQCKASPTFTPTCPQQCLPVLSPDIVNVSVQLGRPAVAFLSGGLGGPRPPRFLLGFLLGLPSFFHNFPFKFVLLIYPVDDVRLAMFWTII